MKDRKSTLLGNLDIVGVVLIAIFAKIYVDFKQAETKYDKTL